MLSIWKYLRNLLQKLPGEHPQHGARGRAFSTLINTDFILDGCHDHHFGLSAKRWDVLDDKTFWVTGGGTGYGKALATVLSAAGANVFISGRRREKLEQTISYIQEKGISATNVHIITLDITDPESVVRAAGTVLASTPVLSGLVHCAALPEPPCGPFPLMAATPRQWADLMNTNVTGGWLTTQAVIGAMAEAGKARVVFFSSTAGWNFTAGFGPYNVSKAAVNNLGASFATEVAHRYPDSDIQINVLDPGEARTEMNQGSEESPYCVVPMTLLLLSHPPGGPNGKFFFRDGRHLEFLAAQPHAAPLTSPDAPS